jgi:hypothetical protein
MNLAESLHRDELLIQQLLNVFIRFSSKHRGEDKTSGVLRNKKRADTGHNIGCQSDASWKGKFLQVRRMGEHGGERQRGRVLK